MQLFSGCLKVHRNHVTLDEFGHFCGNRTSAEQLTSFLVENDFHQALLPISPWGPALPLPMKEKTTDFDIEFFLVLLPLR